MAKNWNETIQAMNRDGFKAHPTDLDDRIAADPLVKVVESARLADLMPRGIPISEMPDEFKDGRKVLVFGEYQMQIDGHTIRDEPKWHGAKFDEHDEVWFPINPDAKSYVCIEASHFLPYPADPK